MYMLGICKLAMNVVEDCRIASYLSNIYNDCVRVFVSVCVYSYVKYDDG